VESAIRRLQEQLDKADLVREQIELVNDRAMDLSGSLRNHEEQVAALLAKEQDIARVRKETEEMRLRLGDLRESFSTLQERSRVLDNTEQRLTGLAQLSARVDRQMESVNQRSFLVESTDRRLAELAALHGQIIAQLDSLAERRDELGKTVADLAEFRKISTEVSDRVRQLTGKLGVVDEAHGRLVKLENLTDKLDAKSEDLSGRLQFVEGLEGRLNELGELSHSIDVRMDSQLGKQSELESMRVAQEGLALQLDDLKKLAASLQGSQRLARLGESLTDMEVRLEGVERRLQGAERLEQALAQSDQRMAEIRASVDDLGDKLDHHGQRLATIGVEGERARELHAAWLQEVEAMERRQRSIEDLSTTAEKQLGGMEAFLEQVEAKQASLATAERRLDGYEKRLASFETLVGDLDRRIDSVNSRHALVERIKREVEGIVSTCEQGRKDAMQVVGAKQEINEAKSRLDEIAAQEASLSARFAKIERKFASIEQAELKIDMLNNIMADIEANLENFREKKAIVDHLAEKLAQIDFEIKRAELATKSLQQERQLAMRIQEGIKSLRATKVAPMEGPRLSLIKPAPDDTAEGPAHH